MTAPETFLSLYTQFFTQISKTAAKIEEARGTEEKIKEENLNGGHLIVSHKTKAKSSKINTKCS